MLTFTVSFMDRQALNLLIEPIKADLRVTDTQLSLLQGVGFIISYLAFGPVFGRLADIGHRRNILICGVVLWSSFTIFCGYATSLPMLLLGRAGVGAAEAALVAAGSLIADYFTKEKLPRAISIHFLGPYIGGGLALIFGGLILGYSGSLARVVPALNVFRPWQIAFFVIGAPGFLLALALLLIREPPRPTRATGTPDRSFGWREAAAYLWERRAFHARFATTWACIGLVLYTLPAWVPSLLIRLFGSDPKHVGLIFGTLSLLAGSAGVLTGPWFSNRLRRRWGDAAVIICVVICAAMLCLTICGLLFARSFTQAVILAGIATFLYSVPQALCQSTMLTATPSRMRGLTTSLYVICVSGFGLGVGPTLVALLTDYVFQDPAKIGYSVTIVCATSALAAAVMGISAVPHFRRLLAEEAGEV
jgi:MFS family permease